MAFVLPTFVLECAVHTYEVHPTIGPLRFIVECQLRAPDMSVAALNAITPNLVCGQVLLLPKLTDIRDFNSALGNMQDHIEVPVNSGCYYDAMYVGDIAKGFDNEHRYAILRKRGNGFPVPMP